MKKVVYAMVMMSLILPCLAMGNVAEDVTIVPDEVWVNVSLGENFTIEVALSPNESIYDDIVFESEYLIEYIPVGAHIEPMVQGNFTLIMGTLEEYERGPEELNLTYIVVDDIITVSGRNGTEEIFIGNITVHMNTTLPELELTEREYVFKQCFIENNQEFCTEFNFTEMIEKYQNITIVNETIENISYNIMMPYNTTKQFMEEYANTLKDAADQMSEERKWIAEMLNETLQMQYEENNKFQNAFMLENYLKNENVPLWIEIAPENQLINVTGFTEQQLMDAMNLLFMENKISQKTISEIVTLPIQSGIMTQEIQRVYIASSERVQGNTEKYAAQNAVYLSIGITIMAIVMIIFWKFFWNGRVGF